MTGCSGHLGCLPLQPARVKASAASVALSIEAEYRQRLADRHAAVADRGRVGLRFSQLRVAIAVVAVVMAVRGGLEGVQWLLLPLVTFITVAVLHARVLNARDRAVSAVHFYERNLARLAGKWAGTGRAAQRVSRPDHVYADDLGLFERGGLFELLSTARTEGGEETLAEWLLAPASPDVVRARQDAVRELIPRLDLREAVAVTGDFVQVHVNAARIRHWATGPMLLRGTATRVAIPVLVGAAIGVTAYWARTGALSALAFGLLAAQGLVATWFRNRVQDAAGAVDEPAH